MTVTMKSKMRKVSGDDASKVGASAAAATSSSSSSSSSTSNDDEDDHDAKKDAHSDTDENDEKPRSKLYLRTSPSELHTQGR